MTTVILKTQYDLRDAGLISQSVPRKRKTAQSLQTENGQWIVTEVDVGASNDVPIK